MNEAKYKKDIWTSNAIHRNCPLCGENIFEVIATRMKDDINLPTVICKNCTLVYTNPIPTIDTYNRFYTEVYNDYYIHSKELNLENEKRCPPDYAKKIEVLKKHNIPTEAKILEIGSGNGRFLYWLTKDFSNSTGIEPGPNIQKAIKEYGLNAIEGFFETYDFAKTKKFDVITMFHVFEHFYDINLTLAKCSSLLTDEGYLYFEVPNILKPYRSLNRYFLRYVHLINYSEKTVEDMLNKHGYRVLEKKTYRNARTSPFNLLILAQKTKLTNGILPAFDNDFKRIIRKLRCYRLKWTLFERYIFAFVSFKRKSISKLKQLLLKTKAGAWLKKIIKK